VALLVVSAPLRQVTGVAWAEAVAIALLGSLCLALWRPPSEQPLRVWTAAGLLGGAAFATRYPLVVGLPIAALLALHDRDWRGTLRRALAYALGFGPVLAGIVYRNLLRSGFLAGNDRNPSTIPVLEASPVYRRNFVR
jgi:hypothetical protein